MGTSGLYGFVVNGEKRMTYNHYDSYPSGLGRDILEWLRDVDNFDAVRKDALKLRIVNQDAEPTDAEREQYAEHWSEVSTGRNWYAQLRHLQGDLGGLLEAGIMLDAEGYGGAYTYVVNLDEQTFSAAYTYNRHEVLGSWPLADLPTVDAFLEHTKDHG